ncbi:MAG: FAD-binding oxidoreductase [Parachlamydiales bacterium]|nr:FAD-binding oxidoreductase [Parachlamydiales bacterium]
MLYRIGFLCLFCCSLFSAEHVYLKTPNISQQEIIGTNVGIRPYRKTGIRLETESFLDKLIIHNYGYGGSGLTLSFGGAKEVLEILTNQKSSSKSVAILGAGVAGLSTAYDLLEKGYDVHIYANEWSPNLISNVAAGIWSPLAFPSDIPEKNKQLHQRFLEAAEQRFLNSIGAEPEFAGVSIISSYSFKTNSTQEALKTKHRGEEVVVHFDNGITKNGRRIYELAIDGKLFMEDLYSKVKSKGAVLEQTHFKNLDDLLSLEETIIINCMSLGSRELFNDQEFIPLRGQIVYFKPQEGIDYLLYQNVPNDTNSWVSIYPWSDRIILGGVYEYGEEELIIDPKIIEKIIQNAQNCLSNAL